MKLTLAENIRAFRKQRGLTQEQLAEVMGVTVGAVHKWETRLSTPELTLIAELADFFEVSTDTLLGYEMKDNRLKATTDRLGQYINEEDPEGMNEAERALKRFPNNFSVVYLSAVTYMMFGGKSRDERLLARAMELLEKSLLLLPQNPNQAIGESSIYEYMANVQMMWGKGRQAAELLIAHNREGVFNHHIGLILSVMCQSPSSSWVHRGPPIVPLRMHPPTSWHVPGSVPRERRPECSPSCTTHRATIPSPSTTVRGSGRCTPHVVTHSRASTRPPWRTSMRPVRSSS